MNETLTNLERESVEYQKILSLIREILLKEKPEKVGAPKSGANDMMMGCADKIYEMRHIRKDMTILDRIRAELALYEELVTAFK